MAALGSVFSIGVCQAQETTETAVPKNAAEHHLSEFELPPAVKGGDGRDYDEAVLFANLTSPRQTWESMLKLLNAYGDEIMHHGFTYDNDERLEYLEGQIVCLFDLREIAPALRKDRAMEAAIYLRECVARFNRPENDELPDREEAFMQMKNGFPGVWSVFGSPVEIDYIEEGEYEGKFQFSGYTVLHADVMYESVKDYSYVDKSVDGLLHAYFNTPGPAIPDSYVLLLPKWMHGSLWGMRVWQFFLTVVLTLAAVLIVLVANRIVSMLSRHWRPLWRSMLWLLVPVLMIFMARTLVWALDEQVFLTGPVLLVAYYIEEAVVLLTSVVIVFVVGNILTELIFLTPRFAKKGVDTYLVRFGLRLASIVVAAVVLMEGLQRMGFTLATVLAGAGVTGLAVALAAQESLRNIFGSIMLLLDKPFKIGQRVKVRGHDGTLEEIGLRSTKIRLLNGHLASIPNEDVARADIENIGERPYIRRVTNITITYDTSPEKIDEAVEIIRDILAVRDVEKTPEEKEADPAHADEPRKLNAEINQPNFPPRVCFNELNADSLNILVIYWYHPPAYWDYMAHAQYVNRELMRRFYDAGIDFAFPTQTLHLAGDPARPLEIGCRHVTGEEEDIQVAGMRELEAKPEEPSSNPSEAPAAPKAKPTAQEAAPIEDEIGQGDEADEADSAGDAPEGGTRG